MLKILLIILVVIILIRISVIAVWIVLALLGLIGSMFAKPCAAMTRTNTWGKLFKNFFAIILVGILAIALAIGILLITGPHEEYLGDGWYRISLLPAVLPLIVFIGVVLALICFVVGLSNIVRRRFPQ